MTLEYCDDATAAIEEQVVDMEFSGVGLRAYDLALFMQMLLLKLLGEHWRTRHKENISQEEEEKEKEKVRNRVHLEGGQG